MKGKVNILCSICVRAGSKGFINKNFKLLNKKTLLEHTIDQAVKSKIFHTIAISSDSPNAEKIAKKKSIFFIKRSKNLSGDKVSKIKVIKDLLVHAEKSKKIRFNYICDLDVTSPLREINDILKSYKKFIKEKSDNLITVCDSRKNPYFNMIEIKKNRVVLVKKVKKKIVGRQMAPKVYEMNASIYFWKRDILFENDAIFRNKTSVYKMPYNRSIDIDSEVDYLIVKSLYDKK